MKNCQQGRDVLFKNGEKIDNQLNLLYNPYTTLLERYIMKPQCETPSNCLEQLARVMQEFGFKTVLGAINSGYVRFSGSPFILESDLYLPSLDIPELWSFAIAKLEGKPVFLGDTCYFNGVPIVISGIAETLTTGVFLTLQTDHEKLVWNVCINELSWTPPKQTVTLKVGDNEPVEVVKVLGCYSGGNHGRDTYIEHETLEAAAQFRKAMTQLVKE